jgi:hypothetical protein
MRRSFLLLAALVAVSARGQARFRFDPPVPDSSKPFAIIGTVTSTITCGVRVDATLSGTTITVQLSEVTLLLCLPDGQPRRTGFTARVETIPAGVYDIVVRDPEGVVGGGTVAVQEVSPSFAVFPNAARIGDQIALSANNIGQCGDKVCASARVFFGAFEAHVDAVEASRILVTVPLHDPGAVPITVETDAGKLRTEAAFFYAAQAGPPDLEFFERVLFPSIVSGPGAFGSLWETRISLRNGDILLTSPGPTLFHIRCVTPCDDRPTVRWRGTVTGINAPRGFLEYVPRQSSASLSFNERVRNVARAGDSGTSIPVIREDEATLRDLPDVPNEPETRLMLRLYSINGPATIHVAVASAENHQRALADLIVPLTPVDGSVDLAEATVDLAEYPLSGIPSLAILFDRSPLRGVWGFVSVTNNNTQHVTVIAPE